MITPLIELFRQTFGEKPQNIAPLTGAGSNRAYYRLTKHDNTTCVGVIGQNRAENHSFVYLSRHFFAKGFSVPQVLAVSPDEHCYLQTDLGTVSLYDAIATGRTSGQYSEQEESLLAQTLRLLPLLQYRGAEGLQREHLLPPIDFNRRTILFDLHYFKYCFFKPVDAPLPNENALEDDFERWAEHLMACQTTPATFLYRDFQARNVMLPAGTPTFIDFQSGRFGPPHYDLASFLWQSSANYSDELRERLIQVYMESLSAFTEIHPQRFRQELRHFVLFRTLQVLGAYGLRGYFEQKPYFLQSIPKAIASLRQQLEGDLLADFPTLQTTLTTLVHLPRFSHP